MTYEYEVQTVGGSSFDNLERLGERLQEALNGAEASSRVGQGWELWQVDALNDPQGINGLVLVYRRAALNPSGVGAGSGQEGGQ